MVNRFAMLAAGALLIGSAAPALADDNSVTFGQFFQQNGGQRLFNYINALPLSVGAEIYTTASEASNVPGAIPIFFLLSGDNLPVDLDDPQDARLSVDFISTTGTTAGSGTGRVQAFGSGTISILRSAPLSGLSNLLSVTFTNAELDADQNSGSFTFKSNQDSSITYTSDFLSFGNITGADFSFSFSGASPKFSAALGSSSVNTRFSGTGTFAATAGVPEISTWGMLFIGFGAVGALMRAGRRQKDLYAA
jgi:hypothetical protein